MFGRTRQGDNGHKEGVDESTIGEAEKRNIRLQRRSHATKKDPIAKEHRNHPTPLTRSMMALTSGYVRPTHATARQPTQPTAYGANDG